MSPKAVVITGAASGIGLALATRFASANAKIVMADVAGDTLRARADELSARGASVTTFVADLTDQRAVDALAQSAYEAVGEIDVVCNNAGVVGPIGEPLWRVSLEPMRRVIDINFWSHLFVARAFVPRLLAQQKPAHIIHTASMSAFVVGAASAAYAASKHADLAVARSLRADLAGTHVRVSVLCPGRVDTPMTRGLVAPKNATGTTTVSPEAVVDAVERALQTGSFYVFTNPDAAGRVSEQFEDISRHLQDKASEAGRAFERER
jgi:1-deoxy-11beta-hydroxypentalenate dehydrogenase